jgi:hypothetical protein
MNLTDRERLIEKLTAMDNRYEPWSTDDWNLLELSLPAILADLRRIDRMEKALRYYADVEGDENAMGGNLDGMGRYVHHKSKGIQAWDELDQGRTAKEALEVRDE